MTVCAPMAAETYNRVCTYTRYSPRVRPRTEAAIVTQLQQWRAGKKIGCTKKFEFLHGLNYEAYTGNGRITCFAGGLSAMLVGGVGGVQFSLPNKWSKRELRRRSAGWVAISVFCFVDGIVALLSPHCKTRLDNTVAASESSASTLRDCCTVSAKRTTLACFRGARDTAMLLSAALSMCVQR